MWGTEMPTKILPAFKIVAQANDASPGPWALGIDYGVYMDEIEDRDRRTIATVWTQRTPNWSERHHQTRHETRPDPRGMANAKMMISAPEMLRALERIAILECGEASDLASQVLSDIWGTDGMV